jgi:hypothetical protein
LFGLVRQVNLMLDASTQSGAVIVGAFWSEDQIDAMGSSRHSVTELPCDDFACDEFEVQP